MIKVKKVGIVIVNNDIIMIFKNTDDKIFNEYKRLSKCKKTKQFNPKTYKIVEVGKCLKQ